MSTEPRNVRTLESFSRSLLELTVNSKPHINFLTMVAHENLYQAEAIAKAVQDHLSKTSCIMKLPILYLIDSIIKNVGKEYIGLFSPVLVNNFANIYAEVDKCTQQLMGVLRHTWNGIISPADLSKLDIHVHTVDHHWQLPSDALKNTTIKILLNPNFLPQLQKVQNKDSTQEEPFKTVQDLPDEVDEAEVLREQLLLHKKQRELEKKKNQLEKRIVENNTQSGSCAEITEGSSEAPIVIDLEPRESQVDSTTVDKSPNMPSLVTSPDVQSSPSKVSTTLDEPISNKRLSGELLECLTDLIAKQNVKLPSDENHVADQTTDKDCCNEFSRTSDRHSGRYTRRRFYKNNHKYRCSRSKSADRSHKYSYRRDERNKYRYNSKKEVHDCKLVSKDLHRDQCLSSLRGNEDLSQNKRKHSQVSTCGKDSLDSSVSTSSHTSVSCSTEENGLLAPCLSSYYGEKNCSLKSPEQNQTLSKCIPQDKAPVDIHLNCNLNDGRNLYHNSREYKKALLPTPSSPALILESTKPTCSIQSQSILLVQNIQTGLYHSTKQFSCISSKEKEVVEIKLQKEIDYNHGLRCPENKLTIEHPNTNYQIRNNQSLLPLPLCYPSSPVNVEYLPRKSPVKTCLEGPLFSLPPASNYILGKIAQDTVKTILVDNMTKEVQFYGEIAVIDSGENNPREISFKPGEACIIVNNVVVDCAFNQPERKVFLGGKIFRVHFGAPTRELYVNDEPFQFQFNFPAELIQLSSGEILSVQLYSPATPLVHIGATRRDLVAGHVTMSIDTTQSLRILLHAKPQRFDIDGIPHILKFADALQTIFINDYLVNLKFGGPPILINVNGRRHQIQLSALPFGVIPGEVNINSMAQTGKRPDTVPNDLLHDPFMPSDNDPELSSMQSRSFADGEKRKLNLPSGRPKRRKTSVQQGTRMQNTHGKSKTFKLLDHNNSAERDPQVFYPNNNIHSLFQSLCEVGLLIPKSQVTGVEKVKSSDVQVHIVDFKDLSSLKRKQPGIVEILYGGVQCNSCGDRFPPELTDVYRQHLDWHFHQNHRTKYSTRCHNRAWYCEKQVWINSKGFIDTINTEDRPLTKECDNVDNSPRENHSVPSHGYPQGTVCEMCGDMFDEFFNEDQDEWQLKNCLLFEKKLYHPSCFNDHQASTIMLDTQIIMNDGNDNNTLLKHSKISEESADKHTDCANDSATEIENNLAKDCANKTADNSSVILIDDTSSELKRIDCAVLEADNAASPILSMEQDPAQGESKVAFLSVRKPSIDGKNTLEINQIETIAVELSSNCVEAATLSYPSATPTEMHVSSPTDVCDNTYNTLEPSFPNDSETSLLPLLRESEDVRNVCLKPKLVGRKLSQLPPTIKGSETSCMCRIS